jgi:hypothetical protein
MSTVALEKVASDVAEGVVNTKNWYRREADLWA